MSRTLRTLPKMPILIHDFFFDRSFPRRAVEKLYSVWIRQCCLDRQADAVLVLQVDGRARGFITCHLVNSETGQCQLAALHPDFRGRGLGQKLYSAALAWLARQGAKKMVFVTQARNIRTQRLYARLGFQLESIELWYHRWFGTCHQHSADS